MTHGFDWRSAFEAIRSWLRELSFFTPEPARAEPQATMSGTVTAAWAKVSSEAADLLLMRMEALQSDPAQVRAAMPNEFPVLAPVCDFVGDTHSLRRTSAAHPLADAEPPTVPE